jgi:hypothetical protein
VTLEVRQQFMSNAIPHVPEICVGRVFAPRLTCAIEIVSQLAARGEQDWSNPPGRRSRNASKSSGAGATQKAQQNRFDLIVGRVRCGNTVGAGRLTHLGEELPTRDAAGHFE